jgi:rhamnogalacturonyl hydrolase YesR
MHNFAGSRGHLWDRLVSWITTVLPIADTPEPQSP